jgi:hypothetical protein
MGATNLDATAETGNLQAVVKDGAINEDVMQQIWDISKIPLPLTDLIGTGSADNPYKSWVTDKLAQPDVANAAFDGEDDFSAVNNSSLADQERIGNHCQEPYKVVKVSERARNVDTIGRSDELAYQIMMRQQELRRDVEAIINTAQASVADAGSNTNEGRSAGFYAFIRDAGQTLPGNAFVGAGAGAAPGFQSSGLITAPTAGTPRALTEVLVRDACQAAYDDGGDPYIMMSTPTVIRKFSEYLFTSSARIASLMSDTGQQAGAVTAKGSVNVFVTDFGINLELTPNRLQQVEDPSGTPFTNVGIIDPSYIELCFLNGYTTDELAKTGLADKRLMHCDFTLAVKNLDAHATILDVDHTAPVTAS